MCIRDRAWDENGFGESRRRARLQATLDCLQSGVEAHLRLLVDSFTERVLNLLACYPVCHLGFGMLVEGPKRHPSQQNEKEAMGARCNLSPKKCAVQLVAAPGDSMVRVHGVLRGRC